MMRYKNSKIRIHKFYEDEHLYSVILRSFYNNSFFNRRVFLTNVLEIPYYVHRLFTYNLLISIDDPEEAFKHTEYPHFLSVFPKERQKEVKRRLLEGERIRDLINTGFSLYKSLGFMYCPDCFREDIKNRIFPYFRIKHQIHGIRVCSKHKVYLEPADINRLQFLRSDQVKEVRPAREAEIRLMENFVKFLILIRSV